MEGNALGPDREGHVAVQRAAVAEQGAGQVEAVAEGDVVAAAGRRHEIGAADEAGDEARPGTRVELVGGVHLLDAARVHHGDAVGGHHRLALVVRDIHGGEAERVVQAADLEAHLLAQIGVEVGQGLVEQEHARLDHHGAGERHALLLAARQLGGIALGERAEAHRLQYRRRPWPGSCRAVETAQLEAEGHVLRDGHVGPDGVALEDHGHAAPLGRQRRAGRRDHLAVHARSCRPSAARSPRSCAVWSSCRSPRGRAAR